MFRQSIENLKKQIIENSGMGSELFEKNEFNYLTKYIQENEILNSVIIGQIEGELYLIAFTDKRLFLVKRETLLGSEVKRFGLEEIKDMELISKQNSAELKLVFFDNNKIRIDSISLEKAKSFGKKLVKNIQLWNNELGE